jgi:hypothetical protein
LNLALLKNTQPPIEFMIGGEAVSCKLVREIQHKVDKKYRMCSGIDQRDIIFTFQ